MTKIHGRLATIESWAKRPVERDLLIAKCCLIWGLSRRTVLDYIKILIDSGKLETDGKTVKLPGK
tara:strand:- start:698 stop:892 length:195 start_codon:yes stop_codon:yes gene_type:complete